MSIEDTKTKIAVMQAYVDGKGIQRRNAGSNDEWDDADRPVWNWPDVEYRVAPPKPREAWGTFHKSGEPGHLFEDEKEARTWAANTGGTYAKFVEVL